MRASLLKLNALLRRRDRRNLVLLLIMMVIGALLEVVGVSAIPLYMSAVVYPQRFMEYPVVREVLHWLGLGDTREVLVWGSMALFLVFGLKNAFLIWNFYWQARFIAHRRVHLARRLITAYMRAPYTLHLARNSSELIRNIDQEVKLVAVQVIGPLLEIATRSLILVAVLGFLLWMEPWITLAWMAVFGLMAVFGVGAISTRMRHHGLAEQEHRKQVLQALQQGFGSLKEARLLGRNDFFIGRVTSSVSRIASASQFQLFAGRMISPLTEFIGITGLSAITIALVLLGRPLESILVTLALFVVALVRLRDSVNVIMSQWANMRYHIVAVEPVYADLQALESLEAPATAPAAGPQIPLTRGIELRDVWYTYAGASAPTLQGMNLWIPAGAAVGFVGGTGAGKSTTVDMILGLLVPQRGMVLVDGADIHGGDIGAWQTRIGYIPQSIYLLDDTLRRNIALGMEDHEIDEAALAHAVRAAQLEELIARLPAGLETLAGEQGVRLSGGERQRVGIARALYHDPPVLIMDEATSALDNTTERAVVQAVEALRGERTVIMIAHRLSTVRHCDTLYFLKEGRIEATGSYEELRVRNADFSLMAAD